MDHVDKLKQHGFCSAMQVGNANFQYALQQLPDLVYPWTTSTNLNVTNATLPGFPAGVPTQLLYDAATVVRSSISSRLS